MATNYDAAVNSFYLAYYGRPADPAGLAYWSQALAQNNGDFSAIIDAFSTSTEATARFGNATPSDRIADVYQQLFSRAPDPAGLEYWTKAIESGTISMADAAIQIMNGAQSTDAQLSTLRQEAAAQFTAEVAASGTAYDGAAAVEAARVLIAAITPESSATDIKTLISATQSLVQTAHDNPEVITALAGSGNLTTLLTSSSGKTDPVAMVQALASVSKAAASDPGALTSLKQGGGMAGLVDKLPAGASLKDVAQAADKGGIAAVTDIVKPAPPSDTTPPAAPTVQLAEDTGASATDHITSNGQIKVGGLEAGSTWQYSLDGKTWTTGPAANGSGIALLNTTATGDQTLQVRSTDAAGNVGAVTTLQYTLKTSFAPTLAFQGPDGNDVTPTALITNTDNYWVNLHGAKGAAAVQFQVSPTGKDGTWTDAKDSDPLADGTHFIRYVVTDAAGNTAPSNALQIIMDHTGGTAPGVRLVEDTGTSHTDRITNNSQVKISGMHAAAVWSYSTDAGKTWVAGTAANADGVALLDLGAGSHSLLVRTFDQNGGVEMFNIGSLDYTVLTAVDTRLAFQGPDGKDSTATKLLTNTDDYRVNLYGTKSAADVDFQVSDTGKGGWVSTKASAPLSDGTHFIRYVVTDLAGNTGITNALEVDMDKTAPGAPKVALVADTGTSATDHITNNGQVKISGIEAGATWQYSTDGNTWTTGPAADQTGTALLDTTANGAQKLQVRAVDAAGNTSAATTLEFTLATTFAPRLAFQGPDGKDLAVNALVTNTDLYWVSLYGAKGAASTSFQISDTGADGTWVTAKDSDPLADGTHFIRYVVTDMAGNTAPSNPLKLVMNHALPGAPGVQLVADTGASATDHITSNGQVKVSGLDATAIWSYSTDDGQTWTAGPAADQAGTALLDLGAGQHHLLVRAFDAVDGNETFSIKALDYTVATAFAPTLAFRDGANGKDLTTVKLLTNTDDYWVTLHGGKDAAKVVFQVSDSGKDGTWADADPAAPLSDGAHFIRYVVTDLAGNTGTTNALEVDMDKTAPAAPTVAFVSDTGASKTDHVTSNGQIQVSGIEAGATWQYTDDGTHWITGATPDADGRATAWLTNGQHTLQVRVVDAAGNTAVTAMPYTLEGAAPAEGLAFDRVAGGAQGSTQTALAKADLVFNYTGAVDAGASVTVQYGAGGFVSAGNASIDTAAKTVTLHDVDLSTNDPFVRVGVTSLGGLSTYSTAVKIDGPYVEYSAQATDGGISLSSTGAGHVYLATSQVGEALAGTTLIGVQPTAAQGVLGVGPSAGVHTDNGIAYGLGTTGADTLAGQYVWGYGGDDHITALGTADNSDFHTTSAIYGGAGADTIDATAGGSTFVYRAVQESTVVAGDSPASGFDTITVGTTGSTTHTQVFDFGTAKVDGFYTLTSGTALTGTETGTELLGLINTAVGHNFHVGTVQAAYIDFGANVNFLVADANADGAIDGADYVVKIVGSIDLTNDFVNASNGHMTLPTA
jgi:uncharacterized protein YdeI (BOF family)